MLLLSAQNLGCEKLAKDTCKASEEMLFLLFYGKPGLA
jgi:hypothetical protein